MEHGETAGNTTKLHIQEAIVVEGRYDKNVLLQLVETTVVCTDGFQIFHDREKQVLLRMLAERQGIIVLTDADGAGQVIRGFLSGILDPARVKHAFIPEIPGKERRKRAPSKEGTLGVEGMRPELLRDILERAGATEAKPGRGITSAALYRLGLSGGPGSGEKRRMLQKKLGLPSRLSSRQLLQVLNALTTEEGLISLLERVPEERQPHGAQEQHTGREFQEHNGQAGILHAAPKEIVIQGEAEHTGGEGQDVL